MSGVRVTIQADEVDIDVAVPAWGGTSVQDIEYALGQACRRAMAAYKAAREES